MVFRCTAPPPTQKARRFPATWTCPRSHHCATTRASRESTRSGRRTTWRGCAAIRAVPAIPTPAREARASSAARQTASVTPSPSSRLLLDNKHNVAGGVLVVLHVNDSKALFVNLAYRHLAYVLAGHDRISSPEQADANTAVQGHTAIGGRQPRLLPQRPASSAFLISAASR